MTPAYARLCFAYLGAVVLRRGTVGLDDFTPERLADPDVLAVAARIRVVADDNPDPAAFTPALAVARRADGTAASVAIQAQLGSPADPLTRAQHLEKARACLAFGGLEDRNGPLAALAERLPETPDVGASLRRLLTA